MLMSLFEGKWPTNKSNGGMVARKVLMVVVSWSIGMGVQAILFMKMIERRTFSTTLTR